MEIVVNLPSARSLKDKRRMIKSLVTRIRNKSNASIAEIGDNDKWQICRLGVAVVSNRSEHAHSQLSSIINMVKMETEMYLVDYQTELI
jgi:uncharacterized protein YlxP (DUF503 family)